MKQYCSFKSRSSTIYILSLFYLFIGQTWKKFKEGDSWPGSRCYNIAACLGYGGQHRRLLISGGAYGASVTYDDLWLMDPESGRMEEVRIALEDLSCYNKQYKKLLLRTLLASE